MDLYAALIKMSQQLEAVDLHDEAQDLLATAEEARNDRPLLDAKPTGQPGTWAKPSGEVIKTSKEPSLPVTSPSGQQTVDPNPQHVSQGLAPQSGFGF